MICPGCGGEGIFHNHPCPHLAEGFRRAAQGIEAQRATTVQQGVVHESPVAESDAPTLSRSRQSNKPGREM